MLSSYLNVFQFFPSQFTAMACHHHIWQCLALSQNVLLCIFRLRCFLCQLPLPCITTDASLGWGAPLALSAEESSLKPLFTVHQGIYCISALISFQLRYRPLAAVNSQNELINWCNRSSKWNKQKPSICGKILMKGKALQKMGMKYLNLTIVMANL